MSGADSATPVSAQSALKALGYAIDEQQTRAWRLAALLRALARDPDDAAGVDRDAVLVAAEYARQIAEALDCVNLPKRGVELRDEADAMRAGHAVVVES